MSMNRFGAAAWMALAVFAAGCEEQGSSTDGSGSNGSSTTGGSSAAPAGGGSTSNVPNGSGFTLRPKSLVGKVDMSGIADAVKNFEINMGRFPTNDEGLRVLVSSDGLSSGSDKWQGPYVDSMDMLVDTYGTALEYENTGNGFILRSLGADGQRGGSGSSADIELRF